MKRVIVIALLALTLSGRAEVTRQNLDEYLEIVKIFESGNYGAAIDRCKAIGGKNDLAAMSLYYIYSRGMFDQPLNVDRATEYRLYKEINDGYLFIRDTYCDTLSLNRSSNSNSDYYPVSDCYAEAMENLNGLCPRVLYQMSFWNVSAMSQPMFDEAVKLKSADAIKDKLPNDLSCFEQLTPQKFKQLRESADLGHVPSMVAVASVLFDNKIGIPTDYPRAKAYLKRAAEICQSYRQKKCHHANQIASEIVRLDEKIPDVSQSTAALIAAITSQKITDEQAIRAYCLVIAGRDDHADCPYYRAMLAKGSTKIEAVNQAAEKGSPAAIRASIRQYANDVKVSWYYYYLGGKYKVEDGRGTDFYAQSLSALERAEMFITPEKYKENLALLAQGYPPAKARYDAAFGSAAGSALPINVEVGYEDKASADWVDMGGKKGLKCVFQPSMELNYVDVVLPPGPQPSMIVYFAYQYSGELVKRVYFYAVYPDDNKELRSLEKMTVLPRRPQRLRLMCEPGANPLEIVINLP